MVGKCSASVNQIIQIHFECNAQSSTLYTQDNFLEIKVNNRKQVDAKL